MKMDLSKPLLFSFDYPPLGGGISRLCSEIVEQAQKHEDLQFEVLTADSEHQARPQREIQALKKILQMKSRPFCLCGLWYPEGLIATLAGVPHRVILAHGSELFPPSQRWRRWLWKRMQNWVLGSADLVIANSDYTAKLVTSVSPLCKVLTLPLAVDPSRFCPGDQAEARAQWKISDSSFVIASVARIYRFKGFETVFRAIAQLPVETRKNIVYVIAGTGPDREELEEIADRIGVSQQIRWLGYLPEGDLPTFYRAADLFVLCTQENAHRREVEGFGLVFLEAQACATPVIGTSAGGIPDAIRENIGGWLISPDDETALAEKISELVAKPEYLKAQGLQARQRVLESCTWKDYVRELFSELESRGLK